MYPAIAVIAVIISMISIQLGTTLAKQLFPLLGVPGTTMLRTTLAALILGAYARPWRGPPLSREAKVTVAVYGLAIGAMNLTFYLSISRISLGVAVALHFIGPLAVTCFNTKRVVDLFWIAVAGLGVVLLLASSMHSGQEAIDPLGVAFALFGALCWATYIVFARRSSQLIASSRATALGMMVATVVVLPFGIYHQQESLLSANIWLYAPLVALLSCAIPYSLEMVALTRLPNKTFGILMSLEPAFAALSGYLVLHEKMYTQQWFGIAAIMTASASSVLSAPNSANAAPVAP